MDENMKKIVAGNLRQLRFKHGWSQQFVADQLGISVKTVSRMETEQQISKKMLKRMSDLFNVPISKFYECEEENKRNIDGLIPDDVLVRIVAQSSLVSGIEREAVLRFSGIVQRDAIMGREDIEAVLKDVITDKKSYTFSDVIGCCLAVNQKTLRNISEMAMA